MVCRLIQGHCTCRLTTPQRRGIPQILAAKFQDGAADKVSKLHCLSFGEGGSFFMAWTDANGKIWKCK